MSSTVYWIYLLDNGRLGRMEGVYEARDEDAAIEQHLLHLGCDPDDEGWDDLVDGLVAVSQANAPCPAHETQIDSVHHRDGSVTHHCHECGEEISA